MSYHFHILVGIFHYRTWLVYFNDGLPQIALGLRERAVGERSNFKKIPTHTQDHGNDIATRGESVVHVPS